MIIEKIISYNKELKLLFEQLSLLEINGQKNSSVYFEISKKVENINRCLQEEYSILLQDPECTWIQLDSLTRKCNFDKFQSDFERVLSQDNNPEIGRAVSYLAKRTGYSTSLFNELIYDINIGQYDIKQTEEFLSGCTDDEFEQYIEDLYFGDVFCQSIRFHDNRTIKIFLDLLDERISKESDETIKKTLIDFKYSFIYQNVDFEYIILGESGQKQYVDPELLVNKCENETAEITIKMNFATIIQLINFIIKAMDSIDTELYRVILADLYITAILENHIKSDEYVNNKLRKLVSLYTKRVSKYIDSKKVKLLFMEILKQKPKTKGKFIPSIKKPKNV